MWDYEEEWRERNEILEDAVRAAEMRYAEGPIGAWRSTESNGIFSEFRMVMFQANGKGLYRWNEWKDGNREYDVHFKYMAGEGRSLLVKLVNAPVEQDWVKVGFGFRAVDKGEVLYLWFEGENPLPAEFADYWPFVGAYRRTRE